MWTSGAWCLTGKFCALCPEGRMFESHSSRHVGTLGKSFSHSSFIHYGDLYSAPSRLTPVPMIGVNCNLWCPGWDGKDLGGRPEQDPGYTSRPWHQYGI